MSNPADKQIQIDSFVLRVLEALRLPVKIAKQTIDSIFTLMLVNIGSAFWLAFFVWQTANSPISSILVAPVIGFPSLILAKLYFTLQEIIALPEKITDFFSTAKGKVSELSEAHNKVRASVKERKFKLADLLSIGQQLRSLLALGKRLRDWFFLAKRLREVKSLLNEVEGLAALTAGAMLLANPLFVLLVALSTVVTATWAMLALVTAAIYLF